MPRSRSRSPRKERDRNGHRERDADRQGEKDGRRIEKDRHVDRNRDRDNRKDRDRDRNERRSRTKRSRSKSPQRHGRRSSSQHRRRSRRSESNDDVVYTGTTHADQDMEETEKEVEEETQPTHNDLEGKDEDEIAMMKLMGFGSFDSTKGKPVPGNGISGANVLQKRKYRQYMNRRGGFNRPLDFVA